MKVTSNLNVNISLPAWLFTGTVRLRIQSFGVYGDYPSYGSYPSYPSATTAPPPPHCAAETASNARGGDGDGSEGGNGGSNGVVCLVAVNLPPPSSSASAAPLSPLSPSAPLSAGDGAASVAALSAPSALELDVFMSGKQGVRAGIVPTTITLTTEALHMYLNVETLFTATRFFSPPTSILVPLYVPSTSATRSRRRVRAAQRASDRSAGEPAQLSLKVVTGSIDLVLSSGILLATTAAPTATQGLGSNSGGGRVGGRRGRSGGRGDVRVDAATGEVVGGVALRLHTTQFFMSYVDRNRDLELLSRTTGGAGGEEAGDGSHMMRSISDIVGLGTLVDVSTMDITVVNLGASISPSHTVPFLDHLPISFSSSSSPSSPLSPSSSSNDSRREGRGGAVVDMGAVFNNWPRLPSFVQDFNLRLSCNFRRQVLVEELLDGSERPVRHSKVAIEVGKVHLHVGLGHLVALQEVGAAATMAMKPVKPVMRGSGEHRKGEEAGERAMFAKTQRRGRGDSRSSPPSHSSPNASAAPTVHAQPVHAPPPAAPPVAPTVPPAVWPISSNDLISMTSERVHPASVEYVEGGGEGGGGHASMYGAAAGGHGMGGHEGMGDMGGGLTGASVMEPERCEGRCLIGAGETYFTNIFITSIIKCENMYTFAL